MENVSKEVKRLLNEDFQFDDTEVADKLLELVKKDKQIQNVVKNANVNDWTTVIRGMVKLVKSGNIPENPEKIANIVQLAAALIKRGIDSKLQEKLKEMAYDDYEYTAKFLVDEIKKIYGEKNDKNDIRHNDASSLIDSKNEKNEDRGCSEGCQNSKRENVSVTEARNLRHCGGFSKFLNEHRIKNIRPGKR